MRHEILAHATAAAVIAGLGCSSGNGDDNVVGAATYPDGPYGLTLGDVIPNMTFYTIDDDPIALSAFYLGSAPAVLFYVTATWCFTCGPEIGWLNDYPPRVDHDLNAMSVLLQNKKFKTATAADARAFSDGYGSSFPTLLSPNGDFEVFGNEAFVPLNVLIDTTTMRITLRKTGFDQLTLDLAIRALTEPN